MSRFIFYIITYYIIVNYFGYFSHYIIYSS